MNDIKFAFILYIFLISCNQLPQNIPVDIQRIIDKSGDNGKELTKTIKRCYKSGDSLKIEACYFLIRNMPDKYCIDTSHAFFIPYNKLFRHVKPHVNRLKDDEIEFKVFDKRARAIWDSIRNKYPKIDLHRSNYRYDINTIKSKFLIKNIDNAFDTWKNNPLTQHVNFEQFCEYLLPYRVKNEPLEDWRKFAVEQYGAVLDTLTDTANVKDVCTIINSDLKEKVQFTKAMYEYPNVMTASKMFDVKIGACPHMVSTTILTMRGLGIPVVNDFIPYYANRGVGHEWCAVLDVDNETYAFDGADEINPSDVNKMPNLVANPHWGYKIAKIFRRTYKIQHSVLNTINSNDIPPLFQQTNFIDVTSQYDAPVSDVKLAVNNNDNHKVAYICVPTKENWRPNFWGEIRNNTVTFKDMRRDIAYLVMYYKNGYFIPASYPFILNKDGDIESIYLDKKNTQTMKLTRKFDYKNHLNDSAKSLINGVFQGANNPDFKDAVNLYTVDQSVYSGQNIAHVYSNKKFRYLRLTCQVEKYVYIGEIRFIGRKTYAEKDSILKGSAIGTKGIEDRPVSKVFDGSIVSYYKNKKQDLDSTSEVKTSEVWVGLDLGEGNEAMISKIEFFPRNDGNEVEPGDEYELEYWDGYQYVSFGKQVATKNYLIFNNVPSNGIYILHDLTKGKEERPFTYKNGKQVFW